MCIYVFLFTTKLTQWLEVYDLTVKIFNRSTNVFLLTQLISPRGIHLRVFQLPKYVLIKRAGKRPSTGNLGSFLKKSVGFSAMFRRVIVCERWRRRAFFWEFSKMCEVYIICRFKLKLKAFLYAHDSTRNKK